MNDYSNSDVDSLTSDNDKSTIDDDSSYEDKKIIDKEENFENEIKDDIDSENTSETTENTNYYDDVDDENRSVDDEYSFQHVFVNDPHIQSKLYRKKEFYIYKTPERPDFETYEDLEKYRKKICNPDEGIVLTPYQSLIPSFINPNTPYRGLLVFSGVGIGKSCLGINTALGFIKQVQRYGTKIHILVPSILLKTSWRNSLVNCTGDYFLKTNKSMIYMNEEEIEIEKKKAIAEALKYIKIMSYKTFYRKVLGDKILEKKVVENSKLKNIYKKNIEGEYEREIVGERIYDLNNSLLIVDEAHNMTGNIQGGETLRTIINNSVNLKLLLLTATPCKNLADDCIELINFLRPSYSQIERDKIFTSTSNFEMELKKNGLDYFKKMASGYISHYRGADEITYAKKIEMGKKPKGLIFTKVTECYMEKLQKDIYEEIEKTGVDSLDKKSESISNFVIPLLTEDKKNIVGGFGGEGLNILKQQCKTDLKLLNDTIATKLLKLNKDENRNFYFVNYNETTKNITGKILHKNYLKHVSTKFHKAYTDMESIIYGDNPRTCFIYSNVVRDGIEKFYEVLLQNGHLEFEENPANYSIKDDTKCYHCGKEHSTHKNVKDHKFSPSTFIKITGKNSEEEEEDTQQYNKQLIIENFFNKSNNKNGKKIQIVLGSKVMNEGISLKNISTVMILDAYYNFGRIEQINGRGIRYCSHYFLMSKDNPYPEVKVFKYVIALENRLSSELVLYAKAEKKYLLVKKIERAMKEVAIDYALNINANIYKEEVEKYKNCVAPDPKYAETDDQSVVDKMCPASCDFTNCFYSSYDENLKNFYDPTRNVFKKIKLNKLDISTFTADLARNEINYSKSKIKELYIINYIYDLETIINYVKFSYGKDKQELFDPFYVQKALDELIPITFNDLLNLVDVVYDKTNRKGYLIYLDGYYLFQPLNEPETLPIYYRKNYKPLNYDSVFGLKSYLKIYKNYKQESFTDFYDFDSGKFYYDKRIENDFVGVIDQIIVGETKEDVFKLRDKLNSNDKRNKESSTYRGSVCFNSKTKKYLDDVGKKLGIKNPSNFTRSKLCNEIKNKLFHLEKYSVGKNKKTFLIIPYNHPTIKFPLNLEDRVDFIKNDVNNLFGVDQVFDVVNNNKSWTISFTNSNVKQSIIDGLVSIGFVKKNNVFEIIIE